MPGRIVVSLAVLMAATAASGQPNVPPALKAAFDAAWARQPEARSLDARLRSVQASRRVAESWTAEPPALEASARSDRPGSNNGAAEYQVGVALPLWLAGERSRAMTLARAEEVALDSRMLAMKLRVAAEVRDAHWSLQRALLDAEVAQGRLTNARALAADVGKRVAAGDLSRADAHQADGMVAGAEVALAEARGAVAASSGRLRAMTGIDAPMAPDGGGEPLPQGGAGEGHPALKELDDRAEVARRAVELAGVRTRANPELVIGTTRERGGFGAAYENSFTVGIRFPFGSEARHEARSSGARAEAIEAEALLLLQRERVSSDIDVARARHQAAEAQLAAADRRAQLARESRGFFERSFRLGQTDLPTRLRIELEAYEAERQAGRFRLELGAAISTLRQTLGLLPE